MRDYNADWRRTVAAGLGMLAALFVALGAWSAVSDTFYYSWRAWLFDFAASFGCLSVALAPVGFVLLVVMIVSAVVRPRKRRR